jgi:PAS domain S-box-containing protein
MGVIHQAFGQTTTDIEGRFTRVDRFTCELLGYAAGELLGRSIRDITHPEDWPSNAHLLERLMTDEEPFTITKRYLRRDGTTVWVQTYVTMLRDTQNEPCFCAVLRPVLPEGGHRPLRRAPPFLAVNQNQEWRAGCWSECLLN